VRPICPECEHLGQAFTSSVTPAPPEASHRALAEWQPIETAPKDGRFVLVADPRLDQPVTIGAYYKADRDEQTGRFSAGSWDGWLSMDGDHLASISHPTHWMPLPDPPAALSTGTETQEPQSK
jgi:hypothetical protein